MNTDDDYEVEMVLTRRVTVIVCASSAQAAQDMVDAGQWDDENLPGSELVDWERRGPARLCP